MGGIAKLILLIHSDASPLNNPKLPNDCFLLQTAEQCADSIVQILSSSAWWQSQQDDSAVIGRFEKNRIAELNVQCDKTAILSPAMFDQIAIGC